MAIGRRASRAYYRHWPTAMPNTESLTDATERLPASAYRAVRYADWRVGALAFLPCQRPTYCQHASLSDAQRRRAIASFELATVPHWTIVDVGDLGASAYRQAASAPAAYSPFAAMVLGAVAHMRRWRYYASEDAPTPAPNQPLDGCHCRVCLLRA